jgi:hypothetical protein
MGTDFDFNSFSKQQVLATNYNNKGTELFPSNLDGHEEQR